MPISDSLKERLKAAFTPEQVEVLLELINSTYNELVKVSDFNELKAIVKELALAQQRTEQRVEELTIAQKRTDEKLASLTEKVEELAIAQKRTEQRVEELAIAQKRTEQRVEELAIAQKRTEQRVEELTIAQKRTEQRVEELAISQKEIQEELKQTQRELRDLARQVGGLAMVVGYSIEDKLYPHLEKFAEKVYKVKVLEIILRKNIIYENGKFDELNIFMEGLLDTQKVFVLGACKAQASKRDIQRFVNILERFELTNKTKVFPFFVSYQYHPDVEEYLKKEYPNIHYYKTYQIEFEKY